MYDSMLGSKELCSDELVAYFSQFPGYHQEEREDLRYLADRLDEMDAILSPLQTKHMGRIQFIVAGLNRRLTESGLRGWYNLPPEELTTDELLFLLIYPFCGRMGGSWEARFATSGMLGKYLVLFRDKHAAEIASQAAEAPRKE